MQIGVPATLMRSGTSKGLFFLAKDLPEDSQQRDSLLLSIFGSPDALQIDGLGGAHPLTSKVAIVSQCEDDSADLNYLFLQVSVDEALVSDAQNCGNMLAGVGPFALEKGLVSAEGTTSSFRIRMLNTGGLALVNLETPEGRISYQGDASIEGVPGTAAPIYVDFAAVAGSSCGALLPTGSPIDQIADVRLSCIDNGMPLVLLMARDFGLSGYESPEQLEANHELKQKIESLRQQAGHLMNLGDVRNKTVPKMCLIAPPLNGGVINTRTFIPHRVHKSIGVLGAASVAAACCIEGSLAAEIANKSSVSDLKIEHPSGSFSLEINISKENDEISVTRSALLRTARKLMEGIVYGELPEAAVGIKEDKS